MNTWIEKIHAPKKSLGIKIICPFLYLLSLLYRGCVSIRNFCYDYKWFKIYRSKATVISIGNIVAGGVGKTPFTLKVAEEMIAKKHRLAILSRGYRSQLEHGKLSTLLSQGRGPLYPPKLCGDEPYLISKRVPKALFYVGKNRVQSAQMAEHANAKFLLLDDAFQHRKIHRDFEVIILDAKDPFGKGHFLPRGFLRDPPKNLQRADLIVINHVERKEEVKSLQKILATLSSAPHVLTQVVTKGIYTLNNKKIASLEGICVGAFCGIAKPHYFYETLEQEGAQILLQHSLSDHEGIEEKKLEAFCAEAQKQGASCVVCTEKDAVKISENRTWTLPIFQVKIDLNILCGEENFQKFFKKISQKKAAKTL